MSKETSQTLKENDRFDKWLNERSNYNSELHKQVQHKISLYKKLLEHCTTIEETINNILETRNALITSLNMSINDYWRGRNPGIVENKIEKNLNLSIDLLNKIIELLEQCEQQNSNTSLSLSSINHSINVHHSSNKPPLPPKRLKKDTDNTTAAENPETELLSFDSLEEYSIDFGQILGNYEGCCAS